MKSEHPKSHHPDPVIDNPGALESDRVRREKADHPDRFDGTQEVARAKPDGVGPVPTHTAPGALRPNVQCFRIVDAADGRHMSSVQYKTKDEAQVAADELRAKHGRDTKVVTEEFHKRFPQ